jgi:hypothetical protein
MISSDCTSKAEGVGRLAPSSAFREAHKFHLIAHLLQEAW